MDGILCVESQSQWRDLIMTERWKRRKEVSEKQVESEMLKSQKMQKERNSLSKGGRRKYQINTAQLDKNTYKRWTRQAVEGGSECVRVGGRFGCSKWRRVGGSKQGYTLKRGRAERERAFYAGMWQCSLYWRWDELIASYQVLTRGEKRAQREARRTSGASKYPAGSGLFKWSTQLWDRKQQQQWLWLEGQAGYNRGKLPPAELEGRLWQFDWMWQGVNGSRFSQGSQACIFKQEYGTSRHRCESVWFLKFFSCVGWSKEQIQFKFICSTLSYICCLHSSNPDWTNVSEPGSSPSILLHFICKLNFKVEASPCLKTRQLWMKRPISTFYELSHVLYFQNSR